MAERCLSGEKQGVRRVRMTRLCACMHVCAIPSVAHPLKLRTGVHAQGARDTLIT